MSSARKFKLKLQPPEQRNPLVTAAVQREAGSHHKPAAATRRAEKMALKKLIYEQ